MNALSSKITTLSTEVLQEMVQNLRNDFSDDASIVTDAVMVELEGRMEESEFVSFCDAL